ncbi:MAG: bifunctional YncE family protein/alkaline phosphatase family protein [Acidobacteriota bacterium]|nr:bifunctional YncE family protein/alkaline phosphatase family protein [Acidobacteriota bacterium]
MNRKLENIVTTLLSILSVIILLTPSVAGQKQPLKDRGEHDREEREGQKDKDDRANVAQQRERRVDDPDEQEDLNRELWEFGSRTKYEIILPYVALAQQQSRETVKAEVELPNGWRIAPAGAQVPVGHLPFEAILFNGKLVVLNTGYYYQEPSTVSIVDPQTAQVIKTVKINSLFPSAQLGLDGDLYISGGFDEKVVRLDKEFKVVREYKIGGYGGGIAALDAQRLVVGYFATKNAKGEYGAGKLVILNTENGKVEKEIDLGYFPYAVRNINGSFYVTLLGENKVLVYDRRLKLVKSIVVGRTPQDICSDSRRLYVVNSDTDDLSVIDARTNKVTSTISLAVKGSRFGAAPSSCAVDATRLYVTLAGTNSLAVLDRRTGKQLASVPTGWYPTKVLANDQQLFVVSAKGIQSRRPNPNGPQATGKSRVPEYVLNLLQGSVSVIAKSDLQKNMSEWTGTAGKGAPIFDPRAGFKLPIRHIFYIIKENRTYDQVLGDLERGNGDPKLTIFGNDISPVHHQLAKEFVTLDNFFVNGEISVLGHSFTSSGYASPFTEWLGNTSYAYKWKGYPFGTVPATTSPAYLWDILDEKGVDYRIYGENYYLFTRAYKIFTELYGAESELAKKFYDKSIAAAAGEDRGQEFNDFAAPYAAEAGTRDAAYTLLGKAAFAERLSRFLTGDDTFAKRMARDERLRRRFADYLYHYPFNFRSWDLKVSDLDRVKAWKADFESQLKSGQVAQLHYIWLPNDHTDGASTRIMNPFQFMAQNDAALGRIVETISHSSIWKESLILIEEDDAQNGPDHVDATRTVALAVGPYVKRGSVVSDRYDQLSMLRTIEILLGLKSLNSTEQLAVPMFGIFTDKPNFEPYVRTKPSSHLIPADRERDNALR